MWFTEVLKQINKVIRTFHLSGGLCYRNTSRRQISRRLFRKALCKITAKQHVQLENTSFLVKFTTTRGGTPVFENHGMKSCGISVESTRNTYSPKKKRETAETQRSASSLDSEIRRSNTPLIAKECKRLQVC